MVRDHESPLFLQLRAIELSPLTAEDTQVLTTKIIGQPLNPAAQAEVYAYSAGHPFYVTAIVGRLCELAPDEPEAISPEQVAQAFVLETPGARGQIYNYCRYLYDISLQKARGYAALKALLQILAEEEGLTLTQAASRLHRRPSSVQDYLRWLIDVDLLVVRKQRYFYSPDGQTEIDALAENGERWAVEVKWRQKRVGRAELEHLSATATSRWSPAAPTAGCAILATPARCWPTWPRPSCSLRSGRCCRRSC